MRDLILFLALVIGFAAVTVVAIWPHLNPDQEDETPDAKP